MRYFVILYFFLLSTSISAQSNKKISINGSVFDKETSEEIAGASVRICNPKDSSMIAGTSTQLNGTFAISMSKGGEYLLITSFMGYKTDYRQIQIPTNKNNFQVEKIELETDAKLLGEAIITANLPKVEASGDSLMYNAKAYRVPAGSMLEDLIKKFPGAVLNDDGTLTLNGRKVTKVLIGGKEFFVSDMSVAMKNIPADMVEQVKFYDKKSDLARITGIDDGNEDPVLDLSVKKDMTKGFFSNMNVAAGSNELYSGRMDLNRFRPDENYTLIASLSNLEGKWSTSNGTSKRNEVGFNYFKKTKKIELGGDARYDYWGQDAVSISSSQTFLSSKRNSYSNNRDRNTNSNYGFNASFRMEWKPDTLTNIIFRPSFRFTDNLSGPIGYSATFNVNPFDYTDDPLRDIHDAGFFPDSSRVNFTYNDSRNNNISRGGNMEFQFFRRLTPRGRSITFRSTGNYSNSDSKQFNRSNTNYFLLKNILGVDSLYYRNQYLYTPANSNEINAHVQYIEPIVKQIYLQIGYTYIYRFNDSDRATYDLTPFIASLEDSPLGYLPPYYGLPDMNLSKFARYDNSIHEAHLSLRVDKEKMNLSIGSNIDNTLTTMDYNQGVLDTIVTRRVMNFSPRIFFRYKINKQTSLRVHYSSNTGHPSMTDMLPIRDETNPMFITEGNPNLNPSFNNNFRTSFYTYNPDKQRGIYVSGFFTNTINSISSRVEYNENTGGVISRPDNINGNWSASTNFGLNTALKDERFSVDTHSGINYSNSVGYIRTESNVDSKKNSTSTLRLNERLRGSFRNDKLELSLNGSIEYEMSNNELMPTGNMEISRYGYGVEGQFHLPKNIILSSDFYHSYRRGYADSSFNTDEFVWNAQLSYTFLKEKKTTLSFAMYDILQQKSNAYRSISATSRYDSHNEDVINSYFMLHLIYKLNIFGI